MVGNFDPIVIQKDSFWRLDSLEDGRLYSNMVDGRNEK
jgi:hypothetical protein